MTKRNAAMGGQGWSLCRWLVLVALAWMLGACGGGAGGGDNTPVDTPPVITAQPTSQSVTSGASATFSVVASGSGLAYQWQRSTDTGTSWIDLTGSVAATYATGPVDAVMNGQQFRVRISSGAASVT